MKEESEKRAREAIEMAHDRDCLLIPMLATPATAGLARTLTGAWLHKWGYAHISDDAFMMVSELITNAINETPRMEIRFQLTRDAEHVYIAVWDSSSRIPTPRQPADLTLETLDLSPDRWDDNGGWGLPTVATLAAKCGCNRDPRGGKWVWASLKP